MGFDPLKDLKFVRLAHDLGLGCGDVRDIEIVGDVDALNENWNFEGPFKEMTFASRNQHRIYWGPLKKPIEWSLKTWLAPWAYVASRRVPRHVLVPDVRAEERAARARERVGPALRELGQGAAGREGRGYPDVGEVSPELIRIGLKHFLEAFRLIGMAVAESPELKSRKLRQEREAARSEHP